MYIHISIHKMRNMRTEIGQVMPVATAIMRISAFIAMRLLRGQGLITRHPVPVMMVRDNHRKQCQDAGHQHHVLYNPLFHFLTHGTKIRIKSEKLTPFGGIFSIMEQFDSTLSSVIDSTLGLRCRSFHFMACFRGQSVCSCNRMSDILCEPVFLLLSSFQVISLDGFILWTIMIYRKVFPLSK